MEVILPVWETKARWSRMVNSTVVLAKKQGINSKDIHTFILE